MERSRVIEAELDDIIAEEKQRLAEYQSKFEQQAMINLEGKTVLIVDDGIATGLTTEAAVLSAKIAMPMSLRRRPRQFRQRLQPPPQGRRPRLRPAGGSHLRCRGPLLLGVHPNHGRGSPGSAERHQEFHHA